MTDSHSKTKVIITLDYEIFGNGSGDVKENMIKPTDRLMDLFESCDFPLTIMAEVVEILKFKEYESLLKKQLGYSPYKLVEAQLARAIENGHDVQLHLHPQWLDAEYHEQWKVDFTKWRTSALSYAELDGIIKKSKKFLESNLQPHTTDYSCICFRAGSLCIQPEEDIVKCLIANNLKIDSTVAKGMKEESELAFYDFRNLPSDNYWIFREKLNKKSNKGILEVPINTVEYNFFKKIFYFISRKFKQKDYYQKRGSSLDMEKRSLNDVFSNEYFKLDIDNMSFCELKSNIIKLSKQDKNNYLVLIGHSKWVNSLNTVKKLLEFIEGSEYLTVSKYGSILE